MRQKLLAVELWALGDLALATPFLRAASKAFDVVLLAKPSALELQPRLWPGVDVIPFDFPWTAFRNKYALAKWPWRALAALTGDLRRRRFDVAVSARWDPRDHVVLRSSGARRRIGFPRLGSGLFLTDSLSLPPSQGHRYENWRLAAQSLGIELPPREEVVPPQPRPGAVVIHTGASQPTKIWPLERFQYLARKLREEEYGVVIACDRGQRDWWLAQGEEPRTADNLGGLLEILDGAALVVGNDSGPGHLAAVLGIPTFTLFGNQFPSRFLPIGGGAESIEGESCPYKPCFDSCRFAQPNCLLAIGQEQAWLKLKLFAARHLAVHLHSNE